MKRLKIGIDIDDVLVDFISAFRLEAERVLGRSFPETATDWSFSNWNITTEERERVWKSVISTPFWFFVNCQPFSDVRTGLQELVVDHELYFITSRPDTAGATAQEQSELFLQKKMGILFPTVLVVREKGPIVAALGLDVFIDDKIENLVSISMYSNALCYVRTIAHNIERRIWSKWIRVNSFTEFVEKIKELNS